MRQLRKLRDLMGFSLNACDGEIGKLEEVYFDDNRWIVRYFIVRTGNWLLGRKVLIMPAVINGIDEEAKTLNVDLTREQIKNCPTVNTKLPVSRHYEEEYYRYYGWEPYWSDGPMSGPALYAPPPVEVVPKDPEHPHLRSSDEVESYSIQTHDGDIGHVVDFILEEPGWVIRYLEVDTRNWLPGKHVLLAPTWIGEVDWAKQDVKAKLNREAIQTAPPYDPARIISQEYQVALFEHYGMKFKQEDGDE